jgi:Helitron helicase-like domain at N-terminus
MKEHRNQTSSQSLHREPCSFCNRNELVAHMKQYFTDQLDISLLENAVGNLREHYKQPRIQSHSLHNGAYLACPSCNRCIKGRQFYKIPLYSWANGCWIGSLPEELHGLSYVEELVIARAHTTKCWVRLNSGSGPRVLHQRAASGNVCIHPHEITVLGKTLPRPMSTLYDEIVVIFAMSDNQEVTPEMFKRTPFLARRGRILRALNWLKENNPLYHNIDIDYEALAEYPEDDNGCVPFPVQYQHANETIRGQNSTYTGHGIDTTEAIFAEDIDSSDTQIPLSVSGTFDVENSEKALNRRKLDTLHRLKGGGSFIKSFTSPETLSPRQDHEVYGLLWPTLFPYGVGLFDDPFRMQNPLGFKPIMLKSHVRHYLQLADHRFQTHLSFIFAMHNIQMIRKSSYQSSLAVRRSWWPKAMKAMTKFDSDTLVGLTAALEAKKARKDYSKITPSTEAESAVFELLQYVDYVSDHIEGSASEVMKMRQEIQAISRSAGTVNIFFTLNPADTFNPLSAFMAGKDINIDTIFGNPDSQFTSFDRARSLAENPVAGAEFFKLMVDQFINVFLGFQRACKRGVFGRVKHYYAVFEAQNRGSLHMHMLIWLEGY